MAIRWTRLIVTACLLWTAALARAALPETGWWYSAAEGGRGWSIEVQKDPRTGEDMMYLAGYMYNDDGTPTWYVSGPTPMQDDANYSGYLRTYGGGITLTGPARPATMTSGDAGRIKINFPSATSATMTLHTGKVISLTRYILAEQGDFKFDPPAMPVPLPSYTPPTPAVTLQNGWWYNAAEGGRGWSIEVQKDPNTGKDMMYLAGYMYNDSGAPTWYVSGPTPMKNTTAYEGYLRVYGNGITLTGGQRNAALLDPAAGSISIDFSSPSTATMVTQTGKVIPLTRYILAEQGDFRFDPPPTGGDPDPAPPPPPPKLLYGGLEWVIDMTRGRWYPEIPGFETSQACSNRGLGWRLPTFNEAAALYDSGAYKGFGWGASDGFMIWTSTPGPTSSDYRMIVAYNNGFKGEFPMTAGGMYTGCVRPATAKAAPVAKATPTKSGSIPANILRDLLKNPWGRL